MYSSLPSPLCSFELYSDNYGTEGGLRDPGPAFTVVGTEAWEATLPKVTQQCVSELRGQSLDTLLLHGNKNKYGKSQLLPQVLPFSRAISVRAARPWVGIRLRWPLDL